MENMTGEYDYYYNSRCEKPTHHSVKICFDIADVPNLTIGEFMYFLALSGEFGDLFDILFFKQGEYYARKRENQAVKRGE